MTCKHDISHLMGTANGIICRACGKLFAGFEALEADRKVESAPEITPEADPAPETEEAPEITPAEPAPKPEAPKTAKKSTKGGKK